MAIRYSPSTGGFYHDALHAEIPTDGVSISDGHHRQLLDDQNRGAKIAPGPDGSPIAVFPDAPSIEARRAHAIALVKGEAYRRIVSAYPLWRQMNDLETPSDAGSARRATRTAIRTASNTIEQRIMTMSPDELDSFTASAPEHWPA